MTRAAVCCLGWAIAAGCGGQPAPALSTAAPLAAQPPPDVTRPWRFDTDVERVHALFPTPDAVWGATDAGVARWHRGERAFSIDRSEGAPAGRVIDVVVSRAGAVYAGLPSGIAWKVPGQTWRTLRVGPLGSGVTALALRADGGVWVGLARGFGWFFDGQLHLLTNRYQVRGIVRGPKGSLWFATAEHGAVALEGRQLVEYTEAQGICGQHVRQMAADAEGRLIAVCAGPQANNRVAVWTEGRWYTYRVDGVPLPLRAAWFGADGPVVEARGSMWRFVPRPVPIAPPLDSLPVSPRAGAIPFAPDPLGVPATPLPRDQQKAPHSPAAAPGAEPGQVRSPVVVEFHPSVRAAGAFRGDPNAAPTYDLERYDAGVPRGVRITARAFGVDGTAWFALSGRGLLGSRGASRERLTSRSLAPAHDAVRLAVRRDGKIFLVGARGLVRRRGRGWAAWPFPGQPDTLPLAVGVDPADRVWALGYVAGDDALIVFRSEDGEHLQAVGRIPLPDDVAGEPRLGVLLVDAAGALQFPVFWIDERGGLRPVGLARVSASLDHMQLLRADLDLSAQPVEGTPWLPDAWINAIAQPTSDALWLATNGGLVRLAGGRVEVYDENRFLDSELILDVDVDARGRVWAVTADGLGRVEGSEWKSVEFPGARERAMAVDVDGAGSVWIGTEEGLWKGGGDKWAKVELGLSPGAVRDIAHRGGELWLLTSRGVLARPPGRKPSADAR